MNVIIERKKPRNPIAKARANNRFFKKRVQPSKKRKLFAELMMKEALT